MKKNAFLFFISCVIPSLSYAHALKNPTGFLPGLTHPVLGFDHFLAMISVGILSAQIGGRAIWKLPLTFVLLMAFGAFLGLMKIPLPLVEFGIACSVSILGIALALQKKLRPLWAVLFVAFFAIFHGHAHGTEMPLNASLGLYSLGFVTGTTLIHLAGVLIGFLADKTKQGPVLLRYVGAGIAGIGIHIIYILIRF